MARTILAVLVLLIFTPPFVSAGRAACDPAIMYQIVRTAVLEKEPSTASEFDRLIAPLGLTQDGHVWKCETENGTLLTTFIGAKRWVTIDYTPNKAEKVPEAILSILAKQGHAEIVGPRAVRFQLRSDEAEIAALGSSAEVNEYVTVSLAGAVHEDTQCTIKLGVRPSSKKQ